MRHLLLAPLVSAYGETLYGVRLAAGLCAAGHEVVFLGPAKLHPLIATAPVTFGRIDLALRQLDQELPRLLARLRCDTLVLVDLSAVGKVVGALGLDPAPFLRPAVPVLALDGWNVPREPAPWDYGPFTEIVHEGFHRLEKRLVPVPACHPDATNGFRALPALTPMSDAERRDVRAELGLAAGDRLVVLPTASWQHAGVHTNPELDALAGKLPGVILPLLAGLGPDVAVAHVGPHAFPDAAARCPGYRHLPQLEPRRFERLVAAADLFLTFNAVSTSLATAVAARTPILVAMSARAAPWTLRAWPLGLDGFLTPTLQGNPFYAAMREAEALDAPGFIAACRELLFDAAAADAMRQQQEAYARRVQDLPSVAERFLSML